MAMEPGPDRPEENEGPDAENPESWYFDLPSGAWERQEAKNRELRQRVLNNLDDEPARLDPFARRPPPETKKSGLFGLGKRKTAAEEPRETAGGTFRLAKGGEAPNFGELPRSAELDDAADDWSTEPDLPIRQHPSAHSEPLDPALARGFDHPEESGPWAEDEPAAQESAAYVEAPKSVSRWADTFGGSDDQSESESELGDDDPMAAMRSWSTKPFVTPQPSTAWGHDAETDQSEADSEFDEEPAINAPDLTVVSLDADTAEDDVPLEPDDPISAMRAWAHKAEATPRPFALRPVPVEPEPAPEAASMEPTVEPERAVDAPRLGFVRQSSEQRAAEEPADKGEKWNEMFDSAPEAPGALSLMSEWAKHKPWDGEGEMPEELLKPFDWELEENESSPSEREEASPTVHIAEAADSVEPATNESAFSWDSTASDDHDWQLAEPASETQAHEDTVVSAPSSSFDWEQESDLPAETPDEQETVVASRPGAFDWERQDSKAEEAEEHPWANDAELMKDPLIARALSGTSPDAEPPAKEEKKSRGLGRIFGRKKKEELLPAAEASTDGGDWLPVESGDTQEQEARAQDPEPATDWTWPAAASSEAPEAEAQYEDDVPVSEWKWPTPNDADTADSGLISPPAASEVEEPQEPAAGLWSWQHDDEPTAEDPNATKVSTGSWDWQSNDLPDPALAFDSDDPANDAVESEPGAWHWQSRETHDEGDVHIPAAEMDATPVDEVAPDAWSWQSNDLPEAPTVVESPVASVEPEAQEPDDSAGAWSWQSNDLPEAPTVVESAVASVEPEAQEPDDSAGAWNWQSNDLPEAPTVVEAPAASVEPEPAKVEDSAGAWSWQPNDLPEAPTAVESPVPSIEPEAAEVEDSAGAWSWQSNDLPEAPTVVESPVASVEPEPAEVEDSTGAWSWQSNDLPEAPTVVEAPAASVEPEPAKVEDSAGAWSWQSNYLPEAPTVVESPVTSIEPEPAEVEDSAGAWNWQSSDLPEASTVVESPVASVEPEDQEPDDAASAWSWQSNDLPEAPIATIEPEAVEAEDSHGAWNWQSNDLPEAPTVVEAPVASVEPEAQDAEDSDGAWKWQSNDLPEAPTVVESPAASVEPGAEVADSAGAWNWQSNDLPEALTVVESPAASVAEADADEAPVLSNLPDGPVFDQPVSFLDAASDEPVEAAHAAAIVDEAAFAPADDVVHVGAWDEAGADEWAPEPAPSADVGEDGPVAQAEIADEDDDEAWAPESFEPQPTSQQAAFAAESAGPTAPERDEEPPLPWWEAASSDVDEEPAVAAPMMHALPADSAAEDEPVTPWWEDEPAEPVSAVAETAVAQAATAEIPDAESDQDQPPATADDDPWAAFLQTRNPHAEVHATAVADGNEPSVDAAPADSPVPSPEEDRWGDVFGSASIPSSPEQETPVDAWGRPLGDVASATTEPEPADDDPWSAIAAASGYDSTANSGAHEPASDIIASLESKLAEADHADWESTQSFPQPTAWPGQSDQSPSEADEPWQNDQDVVLRAFEQHAATPEPEPTRAKQPEPETPLTTLFGEDAADIVGEPEREESRAFQRIQGFAPQRTTRTPSDPANAPWEVEDDDPDHDPTAPIPWGRTSDGALPPPPWGVDPEDGGELRPAPAAQGHSRTKTLVRELVETGLLALLVFLAVRASFQNFKVDGSSMSPTLHDGQFLIVNKLVYSEVNVDKLSNFIPFLDPGSEPKKNVFHGPQRGDIVVLVDPRKPDTDLIKRVIGLPGESLQIVDGKVYINDHLLEEPYIKSPWHDNKQKVVIPDGQYFVMGDNRDNSLDSRSQQVGLVPKDLIIGKAMLSYWPSDDFGLAPNESPTVSQTETVPTVAAQAINP